MAHPLVHPATSSRRRPEAPPLPRHPGLDPGSSRLASARRQDSNDGTAGRKVSRRAEARLLDPGSSPGRRRVGWRRTKIPTPNQHLAASPAKTLKILSAFHSHPAHLKHNSPVPPSDTPQGVAARRDRRWWVRGYASSWSSGSSSNPPGGNGRRVTRFRTGRVVFPMPDLVAWMASSG